MASVTAKRTSKTEVDDVCSSAAVAADSRELPTLLDEASHSPVRLQQRASSTHMMDPSLAVVALQCLVITKYSTATHCTLPRLADGRQCTHSELQESPLANAK